MVPDDVEADIDTLEFIRENFDGTEDAPPVEVPIARSRAPWWRRAIAWVLDREVVSYCARCHSKLDRKDETCEVCKELTRLLHPLTYVGVTIGEATEILECLNSKIVAIPRAGAGISSSR